MTWLARIAPTSEVFLLGRIGGIREEPVAKTHLLRPLMDACWPAALVCAVGAR